MKLKQRLFSKKSLGFVLIVPFVIQILFIGGLVGWLSYMNGQTSVNTITYNLRSEVSKRIEDHLNQFLDTPIHINNTNANLISSGTLDSQNIAEVQHFFLNQVKHIDSITSMYFGTTDGGIIGAGREGALGNYYIYKTNDAQPGNFLKYSVDEYGNQDQLLVNVNDFDARTRPWYTNAIYSGTNSWSGIYFLVTGQDLAIASSLPVYDPENKLIGIVSVDIFLSHLSDFMQELEISDNGIAFIMEPSGHLIATSSSESLIATQNDTNNAQRLLAKESPTQIIAETASFLREKYVKYYNISESEQLDFTIGADRHFVQVTPLAKSYGLDWLIVVVVPESDFIGQMKLHNLITLLAIIFALIITILFNIFLVRRIKKPVAQLSHFTHLIGNERWEGIKSIHSWILEIDLLGESFIKMGQKLRISLQNLKDEIEERKLIENNLQISEDRYRTLLENVPVGVFRLRTNGDLLAANRAALEMFGYHYSEAQLFTNIRNHYIFPAQQKKLLKALNENTEVIAIDIEFKKRNGEIFWSSVTSRIKKDEINGETVIDGIIEDITERKLATDKLQYIATHDRVTELPNRVLFEDRLKHAIKLADRNAKHVVVLLLDLDNFKAVNDVFGHKQGDRLLSLIGKRLLTCVRKSDTVARFGGDEFTILLEGITHLDDTHVIIEKILTAVSEPVILKNAEVYITCSIGVSAFPTNGHTADELIQNADHSLYKVKDSGKNDYRFYSAEMKSEVLERLELKNFLRKALEKNELTIHYQPLVDSIKNEVYGAEALLRWNHPELGLVYPSSFLSLAEETGLIVPIGSWVLEETCRQMKNWLAEGLPLTRISVNISPRQLKSSDLFTTIKNVLQETGLAGEMLELELSENTLFKEADIDFSILNNIKSLGVRLAVDDFGTGFTSLKRLSDYDFDTIKIDRYFAVNCTSAKDAGIVQGIILIAKNLGLEIIVEGVETEAELAFYHLYGCKNIQGWYFSKGLSAADFLVYVQKMIKTIHNK